MGKEAGHELKVPGLFPVFLLVLHLHLEPLDHLRLVFPLGLFPAEEVPVQELALNDFMGGLELLDLVPFVEDLAFEVKVVVPHREELKLIIEAQAGLLVEQIGAQEKPELPDPSVDVELLLILEELQRVFLLGLQLEGLVDVGLPMEGYMVVVVNRGKSY